MNRRRAVIFAVLAAFPLVALGAACSFPDVTFVVPDGGAGSNDAMSANDVVIPDGQFRQDDSGPEFDGAIPDVIVRGDEQAPVDPSACGSSGHPKCDCDNDGFIQSDCDRVDAAIDANAPGNDCDDLDPLRHPNSGFVADIPDANSPKPLGDWNCNSTVETTPPPGLKCVKPTVDPVLGGVLGSQINCHGGGQGFLGTPSCGTKADIYNCPTTQNVGSINDCNAQPTGIEATQQCQ